MQSELQEAKDDLTEKVQLMETRDAELKELDGKLVGSEKQVKDANDENQRIKADWNALQETYHNVSLLTFNIALY